MSEQNPLWTPSSTFIEQSNLRKYERWLAEHKGLAFDGYAAMWEWSTRDIASFWETIWKYVDVIAHTDYDAVLTSRDMPGAQWFSGATLNYAEHIFRAQSSERPALYFKREGHEARPISWEELLENVKKVAIFLAKRGIGKGDRVVAYIPNIPEAIVTFLAVNSLGAIWSCCSPDFGVKTVIDRFSQIEPTCLIAVNGYRYHGKVFDRTKEVEALRAAVPSIQDTILIDYLESGNTSIEDAYNWEDVLAVETNGEGLVCTPVPFDHPIWVLYSSGTTGRPKAITHSHGGVLLEHYKYLLFHNDVHPGEHFFWFTTTGWMMWNFLQASMLVGAVPVLYDGSPGYPDLMELWRLTETLPIHHFGTSAPFLTACMKEGISPGSELDMSTLRSIGSTGAPLPPEAFDWVYEAVSSDVWLCSMSGGTDVCTAFVGGCPYEPVYSGRIQCRGLGCDMKAYDDLGSAIIGEVGEMIIEQPMPSMPVFFWNDESGDRYRASYFDAYPGRWRHGDFIKIYEDGSLEIHGRSDATLNRKGVRIGTAEIYAILDGIAGVKDSLILNLEKGNEDIMPLFVVMEGEDLTEEKIDEIKKALRSQGSPRHVPDMILAVPDIPYTLSGKKMEVPVKKILMGKSVGNSMNKDAIRNPEAVQVFMEMAGETMRGDLSKEK